jgi:hypothetical protein
MISAYQMFVRRRTPGQQTAWAARSTANGKGSGNARDRAGIATPASISRNLLSCFWVAASLLSLAACSVESDCKNQACVCDEGATCDFDCVAPPCHIECRAHTDCSGQCANGSCKCASNSNCAFGCDAPPCHVNCAANTDCSGTCANGECSCGSDSACDFNCQAGPCHVECGARSTCNGECSNGNCECGTDGKCDFTCKEGNCKTICPSGAQCLLTCNGGGDCKFDTCSGAVTECTNGSLACNRACP